MGEIMTVLWVFDQDFVQKGPINTYHFLSWEESYQGRGAFTLMVEDTPYFTSLLKEERFIFMPGRKTAMVIKNRKYDSVLRKITVNGYSTIELIDQRFALGEYQFANFPSAEAGMRSVFQGNIRGFPNLTQSASKGYQDRVEGQFTNRRMPEMFQEICAKTGLGINMLFDYENKRHVFDVYKGANRTINQSGKVPQQFSHEWGSLFNLVITDDKSLFKNVAYVFGSGRGEERYLVIVGDAQGRDRYELPVDARDLQRNDDPQSEGYQTVEEYEANLRARGVKTLNDHISRTNIQAEVDAEEFGVKYDLGDIVSGRSERYSVSLDARIMFYKYMVEGDVPKTILTLGEPAITAIKELRIWAS